VRSLCLGLSLAVLSATATAEPRATFLHDSPTEAEESKPLVLEGSLAGGSFSKVIARVRGPGEPYEDFPLELQYGDLYRGTLPASRMVSPGIEYYFEGVSAEGARTAIFASANQPVRVIVIGDSKPEPVVVKPKCKKGKKCKEEPPPPPPPEPKEPPKEKHPADWVDTTEKPPPEKKEPVAKVEPREPGSRSRPGRPSRIPPGSSRASPRR